ncbi:MAG: PQQ-binding-like beta-propeller repeat protein, partial [Planctomycetales bacterium]|nr:PQQ-binding-like beta-propeller repeat protein [Planctomycetales bacterium]
MKRIQQNRVAAVCRGLAKSSRALRWLLIATIAAIHGAGSVSGAGSGSGADWPAWRYDAGHTASAPDALGDDLQLEWTRTLSPRRTVWDDPLNQDMMQYDRIFEPIAMNGLLFVNFNDADKVVAYDLKDGAERWTFYTDGPVRFPAVAHGEEVSFVSDDGWLYTVGQQDGKLRRKFAGAPGARKAVGNQRVISSWPARGGPVIADGRIYFAASIWPFMGTYIYCLDADTHEVVWLNDSTSSQYIKQPHSAPSFAGVAPQGTMVVSGDTLLVPGGRSVPAAFDRHTGALQHFLFNEGGKGNGGSLVLARGQEFFVHTRHRGVRAYDLASGNKTAFRTNEPVLTDTILYAAETTPALDANGKPIEISEDEELAKPPVGEAVLRAYSATDKSVVWELPVDGRGDLIKAGNRLYAAGTGTKGSTITVLELAPDASAAKVLHSFDVAGTVTRLLTASGKLIAVTNEGQIHCLGNSDGAAQQLATTSLPRPYAEPSPVTKQLLSEVGNRASGYLIYYGAADPQLLDQLLSYSQLDIIVVDEDAERVARLRQQYDAAGVYGARINLHVGNIESYDAPPFIASLVVLVGETARETAASPAALQRAYESVRPYGGCLAIVTDNQLSGEQAAIFLSQADLEKAEVKRQPLVTLAQRVGALTGAADWTHQYGDVANTIKSNDSRVKLPLGILWFGGSSNLDVLPRHGHGPPEQVIGGRLYIEGMNSLSCRDVYTGRVLWKRTFDDLGTFDIYYDATYEDTPLNPQYNQVHIPGANGRGTNFVATEDAVYIVEGSACHVLSLETGETVRKIELPKNADSGEATEWAYIGVYKDVLLGGAGFARYQKSRGISLSDLDSKLSRNSA